MILAGGRGARLSPLTLGVSKQLLPVYDKPMIYYPLTTLMLAGIRDILIVSAPAALEPLRFVMGDGGRWGLRISYTVQPEPRGLADAFLAGRDFVAGGPVGIVLGDNIFFGEGLDEELRKAAGLKRGAAIFASKVKDPTPYGVVELDRRGRAVSVEEKPSKPKSDYAVAGLYFLDGQAVGMAEGLQPSERGELEIADLIRAYLDRGMLQVEILGRTTTWLDAGTPEALLRAAELVKAAQERTQTLIASPEATAYKLGYISGDDLRRQADAIGNRYGESLVHLI
jgi:glucose-1-phosphate thymidylyltransferase